MPLAHEILHRYSRHIRLPQIGELGQQRLLNARVLLIGLGGLGSPAALYLAAAGVGTLGLADFDEVATHNLQRQILFREADVGTAKLTAALASLRALNSQATLIPHPEGLTPANALTLFSQYDIVLDGTDNFPARYLANDAARLANRPLIHGSIFQFTGQITLFDNTASSPCYRCLYPEMPDPESVPTCEQAGVFGALCGVVGSLMAMEAIKHITRVGNSLVGRILLIDLLAGNTHTVSLPRSDTCPICGDTPRIREILAENYARAACATAHTPSTAGDVPLEISCEDAREWLTQRESILLLDVREAVERAICHLPDSIHIPLGALPDYLKEHPFPADKTVLVYCHHGQRSLRAARLLRANGIPATSVAGGINRWAASLDTSLPRY
ncbi:MAG: molybdopterin-synthase adenylyltransferase MoeB [Puniceicoccales bacterium]|jgi:adenylyltransferase/sulfurtransferase|nr:molybdopterin-synthase adenylyltransferase MoeB [Puniceicoccales bacterium]